MLGTLTNFGQDAYYFLFIYGRPIKLWLQYLQYSIYIQFMYNDNLANHEQEEGRVMKGGGSW